MKKQLNKYSQSLLFFFLSMIASFATYAQDGGLDIDVNIGEPEWYQQPWVWIVGAAIFILILVALLRKRK